MTKTIDQPYGQMNIDAAIRWGQLPQDDDGPIWMVNLMAYKKKAVYDGVEAEIDGKAADNLYNPMDVLQKIGASMVFFGDVADQTTSTEPKWDRIAIVKYPTRRAFVEMGARKDFREKHVHKEAGMEQTIVCACLPVPDSLDYIIEPMTEQPLVSDETPITTLHIVRFAEGKKEQARAYLLEMSKAARSRGGEVHGMMASETTFLGDGRSWDQVLIITHPSRQALDASMTDEHKFIVDRYDIEIQPLINELRRSQE